MALLPNFEHSITFACSCMKSGNRTKKKDILFFVCSRNLNEIRWPLNKNSSLAMCKLPDRSNTFKTSETRWLIWPAVYVLGWGSFLGPTGSCWYCFLPWRRSFEDIGNFRKLTDGEPIRVIAMNGAYRNFINAIIASGQEKLSSFPFVNRPNIAYHCSNSNDPIAPFD
jgi:hypothetical protein